MPSHTFSALIGYEVKLKLSSRIWRLLYNAVAVPVLLVFFKAASVVNGKIRRGFEGRRDLFIRLEREIRKYPAGSPWYWVHVSSLGEFEQGKPVVAAIKERNPSAKVVVTFFSPSGYEHARGFKQADLLSYIPLDRPADARRFVDLIRPRAAIFIRYDLWFNHIAALNRRGIPVFVASATVNPRRRRGALAASFLRALYGDARILTISADDEGRFRRLGISAGRIAVMGDTRFDRVWQARESARRRISLPNAVTQSRLIFVVGSSWEEDEAVVLPAIAAVRGKFPSMLTILIPHEPTESNLDRIEAGLNSHFTYLRFSQITSYEGEEILIVDSVGILLSLYSLAAAAFVGGSFKGSVHNVLEPAAFGVPVIVGPTITNSQEAVRLVQEGGAFLVNSDTELSGTLEKIFGDPGFRERAGSVAASFVKARTGATKRFLDALEQEHVL